MKGRGTRKEKEVKEKMKKRRKMMELREEEERRRSARNRDEEGKGSERNEGRTSERKKKEATPPPPGYPTHPPQGVTLIKYPVKCQSFSLVSLETELMSFLWCCVGSYHIILFKNSTLKVCSVLIKEVMFQ